MENLQLLLVNKNTIHLIEDWLNENRSLRILARMSPRLFTEKETIDYLEQDPIVTYIVFKDKEPIGYARINHASRNEMGIGIVIASPENRQKGIGYEVARRLMDIAIIVFGQPSKFIWITSDYNLGSQKLASKLGFELVKEGNKNLYIDGKFHNQLRYEKNVFRSN